MSSTECAAGRANQRWNISEKALTKPVHHRRYRDVQVQVRRVLPVKPESAGTGKRADMDLSIRDRLNRLESAIVIKQRLTEVLPALRGASTGLLNSVTVVASEQST